MAAVAVFVAAAAERYQQVVGIGPGFFPKVVMPVHVVLPVVHLQLAGGTAVTAPVAVALQYGVAPLQPQWVQQQLAVTLQLVLPKGVFLFCHVLKF